MRFKRLFFALLFLALSVSAVNAYTVIMRDGRRVEIPNEFTVTNSTLTYAVGSDFQVTIQLNTVDIAATERANGEARGSFLLRAKAKASQIPIGVASQTAPGSAQRSVTNADLEKYRRARVDSENRRRELGLPSMEERQRETAAIDDRTAEHVRNIRAQEEAYWRSRAEALRAENAAQLSLRQRSEQTPWAYPLGVYPSFWPLDGVGFGITRGPFNGFRRAQSSPFSGFLATPITPFPTFPVTPVFRGHGRIQGIRINPRPFQMKHR